ncbi:F-box only protein 50 [Anolis carolinensis]|uniref:F-box only protein 50 n=1 Tax=Anolis carolinensis TaxID=28377 RepID=UPI002F2B74F5
MAAPQKEPLGSPSLACDWQQRFESKWDLSAKGVPLPKEPDWEALWKQKPFQRNLLQNPNPEGVNVSEPAPPCQPQKTCKLPDFKDIFGGWEVSTERLPLDQAKTLFALPPYSWCVKQQSVDLLAEGLWKELLDQYQPDITIMDWYENSKLDLSVYELHVRLLGSDKEAVIGEFHHVAREKEQDGEEKAWHHVSHVFKGYGPGVRYVHFLHKTKDVETADGLLRTRVTDSSVSVQLKD